MLNNSPLVPGESDIDQLSCVFRSLGSPTAATWPGVEALPDYGKIHFEPVAAAGLDSLVPDADDRSMALLRKFLAYPAAQRLPAHRALLDHLFFTEPLPAHHTELPMPRQRHHGQVGDGWRAGFGDERRAGERLGPGLSLTTCAYAGTENTRHGGHGWQAAVC